jgi:YegS/Rv2252/BmrU family lipid kinase
MDRPVLIIVNPSAGGGAAAGRLPVVQDALDRHGIEYRTEATRSLEHGRELATEAVERGEAAFTLSGDGLAGAVAGVLAGTDGLLGVLPGGRGNDFARKLGIPRDPAEAVEALSGGAEQQIDIADANGQPFVGIASCGIDSDTQVIANSTKAVRGSLVYVYAVLRALADWKPARFDCVIDGEARSWTGYSVAACNSGVFGGGMYLAPEASLTDGLLDVAISHDGPKRKYLASLPKVFKGTHVDQPTFELVQAREIKISADRPFDVYADGDPLAPLPVTIRVRAGALRVLVPR